MPWPMCNGLRDNGRAHLEVLGRVAWIFVVEVAVVDHAEVYHAEAGGADLEYVTVVGRAFLGPAVVGKDDLAAVVGQAKDGDVVFGDLYAVRRGFFDVHQINVGLDANNSRLLRSTGRGRRIGCLQRLELLVGRIVLGEAAVDKVVVGVVGGVELHAGVAVKRRSVAEIVLRMRERYQRRRGHQHHPSNFQNPPVHFHDLS